MKKYKHAKQTKLTERAGFYVVMSVCMMAAAMAVWSAYSALTGTFPSGEEGEYFSSLSTTAEAAQDMTGVTEPDETRITAETAEDQTEEETVQPTQIQEKTRSAALSETRSSQTDSTEHDEPINTMQAVLRVDDSLNYPVKSRKIVKEYSENSVYSKTMKDYRAHTGCDFEADEGEYVYAMSPGTVRDISVSELYGVIIEVDCGEYSVYYCGLDTDIELEEGAEVLSGDIVGTVGHIPSESGDGAHIHIEIRVGDKLIDPLSVIASNG